MKILLLLALICLTLSAQAAAPKKKNTRIVVLSGENEWSVRPDSKETFQQFQAKMGEKASLCYVGEPQAVLPVLETLIGNQKKNGASNVKIQSFSVVPSADREVIDVKIGIENDPNIQVFQALIDRC